MKRKDGIWEEGGVWRYRFCVNKRRYFKANPLWLKRSDAKAARDKHRLAVREGRADREFTDTNFRVFVQESFLPYIHTNKSPGTYQSYKWRCDDLIEAFGRLDLREVSAFGVEKFKLEQLKRRTKRGVKQSPGSVNRYLQVLASIFTLAEKLRLISPADRPQITTLREEGERIRYLSVAEENALRDAANAKWPYLSDIICVACSTGLRREELFGLKKSDVDLMLNTLSVLGKGNKLRSVPLDPNGEARAILARLLKSSRSQYVFTSPHGGGKFTRVDRSLAAACRLSGVEDVTVHTFRHTFCTRLAAAGVDVRTIMELAGHSDITTTLKYTHAVKANVHEAVRRLSGFQEAEVIPITQWRVK